MEQVTHRPSTQLDLSEALGTAAYRNDLAAMRDALNAGASPNSTLFRHAVQERGMAVLRR